MLHDFFSSRFRDPTSEHSTLTTGWLRNFRRRNPGLAIKTPSLIDPGRAKMSRKDVMDSFFKDAETFLRDTKLLNESDRIYNIDESWFSPNDEKKTKVIVPKGMKIPYKTFCGSMEHITMVMCASAGGEWMPPMFIFKGNIPSNTKFIEFGPKDAIYTSTESGHIDKDNYFKYIMHLEPFLHQTRPVVVFQDNLGSHENYELSDYCVQNGIHLFNFPSKTSHILQPLDKLFGPLKTKYDLKRADANMMAQKYVGTSKVPIICRLAMSAVSNETILDAFRETGICPLDRAAISDDLLVGSSTEIIGETPRVTPIVPSTSVPNMPLAMDVFEEDSDIPLSALASTSCEKEIQTDAIKSLPCSICIQNDVSLHPAVTAGVVDIELASVFIPDAVSRSADAKPTRARKCTKGRCITSESEVQRMKVKVKNERN